MEPWSLLENWTEGPSTPRIFEEEDIDPLVSENNGLAVRIPSLNVTRAEISRLSAREEILRHLQLGHYPLLLFRFMEKLQIISAREENWDGKGSQKPNSSAINTAKALLTEFSLSVIESGQVWKTPFISSDEDGHVTIAWKNEKQELHLDISEEGTQYIKVWGTNIEHEMHMSALVPSEYITLWKWLN